jgi:hypothetical protein
LITFEPSTLNGHQPAIGTQWEDLEAVKAKNAVGQTSSSHCRSRFTLFLLALLSIKYMPNKPRLVVSLGLDLMRLVKNPRRLMSRESGENFIVDYYPNFCAPFCIPRGQKWRVTPRHSAASPPLCRLLFCGK